ncbi:tyrosine-type recombinase/integrase [Catenulispora rubra]|uniref:tyrosine-type recombinase/integrase n=1 Tax=Catenulispora rubra TaxID=280293 RepID=UPI00189238E9|nr:tyrosine-type recombinase/integrase [Catenulispora rubra]
MAKGHVERLKNGYRAKVYAGIDPISKKQIYLNGEVRETEEEAVADAGKLLKEAKSKRSPDRSATVAHLLDKWMEISDHELSTAVTNRGYIEQKLKPTIGEYTVRQFQERVDVLDELYNHLRQCSKLCHGKPMTDHRTNRPHDCQPRNKNGTPKANMRDCQPHVCKPMPTATITRINAIIQAAYGYAIAWNWADKNPGKLAHKGKVTKKKAPPHTPQEVAALINAAFEHDEDFGIQLWMSAITGGRRGEIISLRWRDIDLDDGLVCLDENYVVRDGKREFKGTKTDEDRWMSLDSFSVALLSALKARRVAALAQAGLKLKDDAHVFSPEPDGSTPWNPDTYTHRYERLAAKVGVTKPLKNLRHFNATELLKGGVDVATVAERLGHADGGVTTLRFYASGTRTADQRAAEQLSRDLLLHRSGNEGGRPTDLGAGGVEARRHKRRLLMRGKSAARDQ